MKYVPIIGLEIHIELGTKSKMFCSCAADHFGKEPNTLTCPVCLGLPGALPVPNKKAIDWTIKLGQALNCKIAPESKFDRKNYFYPDLPKGYQISQYDMPVATHGEIYLRSDLKYGKSRTLNTRINRVHLEEDTGKLQHAKVKGKDVSLVDFNRSGVPLVEIVTEPDIRSSEDAVVFMKKLRQIVRYLEISDADMEKGSMRIEPNISVYENKRTKVTFPITNYQLPDYKVEVKNINSFNFAKRAIDYEIERHIKLLKHGIVPKQETRGWNEKKNITVSQRSKEEAHDYRYFPEPDIPPTRFSQSYLRRLKANLPEMPDSKAHRFINDYKLSQYDAELLTVNRDLADWFEEAVKAYTQTAHPGIKEKSKLKTKSSAYAKVIANWIMGDMAGLMKTQQSTISNLLIQPAYLAELLYLLDKKEISQTVAKKVFKKSFKTGLHPIKIIDEKKLRISASSHDLENIIKNILKNNPKAIEDYNKGKQNAIGFLVGQVMKETKGQADPKTIKSVLKKTINK